MPTYMADKSALARVETRAEVIVAACAERADLTVLHYDGDYERIAEVTGQPAQWVVPRGSVD